MPRPADVPHPDLSPPAPDVVEVNLFGPGVGESVVVHLGDGAWMVVDCCHGRKQSSPAPLRYLEQIGASPDSIEFVVATHWHDDHVRGIATTFAAATNANFYIAGSVRPDEFRALTGLRATGSRFTSGVDELARVAQIAEERKVSVRAVGPGQRIYYRPTAPVSEVWTLSPSYDDLARSREHLARLLPRYEHDRRRIPSVPPNDTSIVLALETSAGSILLGGDLEHKEDRGRGWHAVVDLGEAPATKSTLFKIPHHGSSNAHCPEVWEKKIDESAIAVLTPFDRGATSLPRSSDRTRLRRLAPQAYLTSDKREQPVPRDRITARTIAAGSRRFTPDTLLMGHIQLRSSDANRWSVALSDEAVAV